MILSLIKRVSKKILKNVYNYIIYFKNLIKDD